MELIELISDRLYLRSIALDDAPAIFSYRKDALANQYQGWIPNDLNAAKDFIATKISSEINVPGTWFQFVIIIMNTNELIGDVGVHFNAENNFQVELGITLSKAHQEKGYATEALQKVITYIFNHLNKNRIIATIDPRNESSIRLFERLGFRNEAHIPNSQFLNGEWVDDLIFGLQPDDWKNPG